MTERELENILEKYQNSFIEKVYGAENEEDDLLMNVFSIPPALTRENGQYWGRQLGMCWQKLVIKTCETYCKNFQPAFRVANDEPCDLIVDQYAIDTKYRFGSGDSGKHKTIKSYGSLLRNRNYEPVLLILRKDNLPAAIKACQAGGWTIYTGGDTFNFIQQISGFDLKLFLSTKAAAFPVNR